MLRLEPFKESLRHDYCRSIAIMVLCDYCTQCRAKSHNDAPKSLSQFDGFNLHNVIFGAQADISSLCTFNWYDLCYYNENIRFFGLPFRKRFFVES
mmetsp:Transcript_12766/g.15639  ORF Transcript_12766/g.15639 Transcript_12766/m.15639 type:complete len:96 (+) Transcript_12766:652-939(+)